VQDHALQGIEEKRAVEDWARALQEGSEPGPPHEASYRVWRSKPVPAEACCTMHVWRVWGAHP